VSVSGLGVYQRANYRLAGAARMGKGRGMSAAPLGNPRSHIFRLTEKRRGEKVSTKKGARPLGRPPLPPKERLSERLMLRLTQEELALLESAAKGEPVSTWAREVLVRHAKGRRRR
jgi:hypothetical protein